MRLRLLATALAVAFCAALVPAQDDAAEELPNRLDFFFIHQSCGANWLSSSDGGLRNAIRRTVTTEGRRFRVHDSHTGNGDQREWPDRFNDYDDWKDYHIVAFKSCYPASHVDSNRMLKEYKRVYRKTLAKVFRENPNILFIIVTAPPNVPNETDQSSANRARKFNNWLMKNFIKKYNRKNPDHKNVAVFDFFDVLANEQPPEMNMLRKQYRHNDWDGHPNKKGNRAATEEFVPFLTEVVDDWAVEK